MFSEVKEDKGNAAVHKSRKGKGPSLDLSASSEAGKEEGGEGKKKRGKEAGAKRFRQERVLDDDDMIEAIVTFGECDCCSDQCCIAMS